MEVKKEKHNKAIKSIYGIYRERKTFCKVYKCFKLMEILADDGELKRSTESDHVLEIMEKVCRS